MTVEEIPSDELIKMTDLFHRAFNAVGCNPTCHCCYEKLPVGSSFKLGTVRKVTPELKGSVNSAISLHCYDSEVVDAIEKNKESVNVNDVSTEVMLCEKCTVGDYQKKELKYYKIGAEAYKKHKDTGAGCFRINGKIVH